jgi:hypothetical protein
VLYSLEWEQGGRIMAFLGAKPREQVLARLRNSVNLGIFRLTRFSAKKDELYNFSGNIILKVSRDLYKKQDFGFDISAQS